MDTCKLKKKISEAEQGENNRSWEGSIQSVKAVEIYCK